MAGEHDGWLDVAMVRIHKRDSSVQPVGPIIWGQITGDSFRQFEPSHRVELIEMANVPAPDNALQGCYLELERVNVMKPMEAREPMRPYLRGSLDQENSRFYVNAEDLRRWAEGE